MQDTSLASRQPQSGELGQDRVGARAAAYCALAAGLLLLFLGVRGAQWRVSPLTPLLLELSAAVVALVVGILALVRYYSRKNNTLLLIGAGLIGTSVLDAYHLMVAARVDVWLMPEDYAATDPWSWFGSRMFLSLLLLWSWTAWRHENRQAGGILSELRIYLEVGAITALSIALFGLVDLPSAVRPGGPVARPFELLPGLVLAIAAVGYLAKGNWRNRPFEVWLVPSLIVGVAVQWLFIPFSESPVDAFATTAQALKLLSYAFIFVGLVASMYGLYRQVERSALLIGHSNEALKVEVEERRNAERASRHSEEKYRTILETIREGYFEVDLAGNFVFWNDSLARILGHPVARLAGLNYRDYTRDAHTTAVFEIFSQVYRTGQPVDLFGWEIVRPDGSVVVAEASAGPIHGPREEIVGFRGIVRDVTARRTAEDLLQSKSRELARSNEDLRQIAHVASHDLQEPLRVVAGYARLLSRELEGGLDEEAAEFIRQILAGTERMQRLIRDLHDYSRVHTHARRFEAVALGDALDWARASLARAIQEADASLTVDALPSVDADAAQMGQLFQHLLANAIRFRSDRPLEIHVGVHGHPGEWHIRVRDNGIGIMQESHSRVFEIFQRLHVGDECEGTGIGLAICRRIVERHDGRIWVESSPGQGATLIFALPRRKTRAEPPPGLVVASRPPSAAPEPTEPVQEDEPGPPAATTAGENDGSRLAKR